jgi:protease-4
MDRKFWLSLILPMMAVCLFAMDISTAAPDAETAAGDKASPLKPVRYAEIEIEGPVLETLPDIYLMKPAVHRLHTLVRRFARAEKDRSVEGVIVRLGTLNAGWAKAQELREAMLRCRAAGKRVICFLEGAGNLEYYIATAADRVVMVPSGSLMLVGLRAEVMFVKNLLDKIGVKGDMIQVGKYKGAAETFTRTSASNPFRRSIDALLDD